LAALNGYVPNLAKDNTALRIYGGDLNGNLWGFDINVGTNNVYKIASKLGAITAPPQVSNVGSNVVLFFGTGRYLGEIDLKTEETGAIYAIKDKTITTSGAEITVSDPSVPISELTEIKDGSANAVNWSEKSGWYYRLTRPGERVVISAQKYGPVLLVASVLPVVLKSCEMGGTGYLYAFNAETGLAAYGNSFLYSTFSTPLVGMTVFQKKDRKTGHVLGVGGDDTEVIVDLPFDDDGGPGQGSGRGARIMWQELNSN
jgi:type IV pilus assembly protein PilY1